MVSQQNAGKDEYIVDLEGNEKLYWLDTESGLIGAFDFGGGCTAGDGSCDPPTRSMGAGFCNFRVMQWNTDTPLSQPFLQEQGIRESSKVVREEEGLSSNRPELVALRECLEAYEDHIDLLYLTDSEASLQAIHKWIGCGAKLNLSKSPDADILKVIILKLQGKRSTRKRYGTTCPTGPCIRGNGPQNRGKQRFLRTRSGLTRCVITFDRKQGNWKTPKFWKLTR